MPTCDEARRHLGAVRDREEASDPDVERHVDACAECRAWSDRVDQLTRTLSLRPVPRSSLVDQALALWDEHRDRSAGRTHLGGRILLAISAAGCLVVGVLVAFGSTGHTHIGVTAQREVVILEVALAFGLACAAVRPRPFLAGILPVLAVVAIVNLSVSLVNLVRADSSLLEELAHLPFVVGLLGAALVRRADPGVVGDPGAARASTRLSRS